MRRINHVKRLVKLSQLLLALSVFFSPFVGAQRPSLANLQTQIDVLSVLTPISSLPYAISQPGSYYVTQNLVAVSGSGNRSIEISADNVMLDLAGFTLNCNNVNDTGIQAGASSSLVIRNGFIQNCGSDGISASGARVAVENVQLIGNGGHGVFLGGTGGRVEKIWANNNGGDGIRVSNMAMVIDNRVSNSAGDGISAGQHALISNNIVVGNLGRGIFSTLVSVVTNNVVSTNDIGMSIGAGSTLVNNASHQNSGWGIVSNSSSLIKNNTSYLNNTANTANVGGISLNANSLAENNIASFNFRTGIGVVGAGSTVRGNHVGDSSDNCYSFSSNDNTVLNNTAVDCITTFGGVLPPGSRFSDNIGW